MTRSRTRSDFFGPQISIPNLRFPGTLILRERLCRTTVHTNLSRIFLCRRCCNNHRFNRVGRNAVQLRQTEDPLAKKVVVICIYSPHLHKTSLPVEKEVTQREASIQLSTMISMEKHTIEAADSWETFRRQRLSEAPSNDAHRQLKHHHKHNYDDDKYSDGKGKLPTLAQMEHEIEEKYMRTQNEEREQSKKHARKKHEKRMKELYTDPGIKESTVHGFMIDAGSTGSRLHLYEFEPRVLHDSHEVQQAVSGRKLTFPGTESRWTDVLRPGLATFASLPDEELTEAIANYLSPLIEFAETILRGKQDSFGTFPIYLRATAGMRTLNKKDRSRVLGTVRSLFSNNTFCPFYFEDEFARILSGEEEAIFGWTGINFAMGNLLEETEGAGTVSNPKMSYGALDMGGASTQISFYEPNEDIMSNLFKLQIGQGKHWNLYAHSYLYYGMNEATNRFHAFLLEGKDVNDRLVKGVYNPCLPGGSKQEVRTNIHVNAKGEETWQYNSSSSESDFYQAILKNDKETGSFEGCMAFAKRLLHLDNNKWCDFAHSGECAINSVYQPELPTQAENFGEFLAFSNYYDVWNFLGLPERASMEELKDATRNVCEMSNEELMDFNEKHGNAEAADVAEYCFRASYTFQLLHNGYGFELDEYVTATNVLNGQKIGWALGAMIYELNTFPWKYEARHPSELVTDSPDSSPLITTAMIQACFFALVLLGFAAALIALFASRRRRTRQLYDPIKEIEEIRV